MKDKCRCAKHARCATCLGLLDAKAPHPTRAELELAIDLRLADTWAQLSTDDVDATSLVFLGRALRLGYAIGFFDAKKGLPFPGTAPAGSNTDESEST